MRNDFESNYLAHHGILGMKWGVKNGPPYPLGASDHSQSEKKAGYKKSIGGGRNEHLYDRKQKTITGSRASSSKPKSTNKEGFHLTENQKKIIKVGATVAGAALVAYGGYRLTKSPKVRTLIYKGMQGSKVKRMANIEKAIQNSGPEIVAKGTVNGKGVFKNFRIPGMKQGKINQLINSGKEWIFKKQGNVLDKDLNLVKFPSSSHMSKSKLASMVNPDYSWLNPGTYMNCGNCALAYEARLRGFDVRAAKNETGMTIAQMGSFFKNLRSDSIVSPPINVPDLDFSSYDSIINRGKQVKSQIESSLLSSYPDGSRGALFFPGTNGSHWLSFEKVGKDIEWTNSQDLNLDIPQFFASYDYKKNSFDAQLTAIRLDDLDFNNNISSAVENNLKGKLSNVLEMATTKNKKFTFYVTNGNNWVTDSLSLYGMK